MVCGFLGGVICVIMSQRVGKSEGLAFPVGIRGLFVFRARSVKAGFDVIEWENRIDVDGFDNTVQKVNTYGKLF